MLELTTIDQVINAHNSGAIPECVFKEISRVVVYCFEGAYLSEETVVACKKLFECDSPLVLDNPLLLSILSEFVNNEPIENRKLADYLGGDIFIVEKAEDLSHIKDNAHIDMLCPNNSTNGGFEDADYVNEDPNSEWAYFFVLASNDGGPTWYIPRSLWTESNAEEWIWRAL